MNKKLLIQKELLSRAKTPDFLSYCFDKQRDFILDPSHYKTAFCTRRSGKSTSLGVYICKVAYDSPGCNILYLGLSKQTAMNVLWKDILKPILQHFNIKVNYTREKITFPNGSVLFAQGINANDKEMDKVLGTKYALCLIDEAQGHYIDTRTLIKQSLSATVQDLFGTIVMTGTPTDDTKTYFYEVTKQQGEREPGWSVHEWNTFDNIAIQSDGYSQAEKARIQINEFKLTNPNIEDDYIFQQQYLGKWVISTTAKMYRFNKDRNLITDTGVLLTLLQDKKWRFILGVDFGWTDASALTVIAYHLNDPNIYVIQSEEHTHWTVIDVGNRIQDLHKSYHFSQIVGDSAAAQSLQTIAKHLLLPIKPTNKTGKKREAISLLNADLITGRIKIDPSNNEELINELSNLIWDPKALANGEYKEQQGAKDHCCDSFLYSYNATKHYRAQDELPNKLDMNLKEDRIAMIDQQDKQDKSIYDTNSIFYQQEDQELELRLQQFRKMNNKA